MSEGQKYHCGPDSWSPLARKILTFFMNAEGCRIHDKAWAVPGADKSAADKDFGRSQFTWWNPFSWFRAPISYASVALAGKKNFAIAQKKAQDKTKETTKSEDL